MKTKKNVTLYICEHCGKYYQKINFCLNHELNCTKNPDNFMKCIFCKNAEKRVMNFIKWVPCLINGEMEEEASIEAYFCKAKQHWIYPHTKVSNPILSENINDEVDNLPMPRKCDSFDEIKPF